MSFIGQNIRILPGLSIHDFDEKVWNELARGVNPMLSWAWLAALEEPGSGLRQCGFQPAHLAIYRGNKPVAIAPLYWKKGVEAEWTASGYIALMIKQEEMSQKERLVGIIPFNPVPGYQFLIHEDEDKHLLYRFLIQTLEELIQGRKTLVQLQHINRDEAALIDATKERRWISERSFTYRWQNNGLIDFEDYLRRFDTKRRNKIKREMKAMKKQDISFRLLKGHDISLTSMKQMVACYHANFKKHYGHEGPLQWPFWQFVFDHFKDFISIIVAQKKNDVIGMNFFVETAQGLYGRWWGALEEIPFVNFNACYYTPIEYAIRTQKTFIDPGYQGKFKRWRGFDPYQVESLIYTDDVALEAYLGAVLPIIEKSEKP